MDAVTAPARRFLLAHRVGHFATASRDAVPSVVPVCYAIGTQVAYIGIDEKPKRSDVFRLRRLVNLRENPRASLCVDRYDEDWRRLGFVLLRAQGEVLTGGDEHALAQALLCDRYDQLGAMNLTGLPVIALRIERVTIWGNIE